VTTAAPPGRRSSRDSSDVGDLERAATIVRALQGVVDAAAAHLASVTSEDGRISVARMDEHQTVLYDLASVASSVSAAERLLAYGEHGDREAMLALVWAADVHADLGGRMAGRWAGWGVDPHSSGIWSDEVSEAVAAGRDTTFLMALADHVLADGEAGPRHLPEDLEMVRQTFRRFAEAVSYTHLTLPTTPYV